MAMNKIATFLLITVLVMVMKPKSTTTSFAAEIDESESVSQRKCNEQCKSECSIMKKYTPEQCNEACTSICQREEVGTESLSAGFGALIGGYFGGGFNFRGAGA
ncbi:hypothetical protein BVRB_1g006250 [Beta vulgaris subsp. vulgaris]|nr:hypothetical protein BVRB_1g006250 [Beta vulgaris subsp. vulgaris]